MLRPALPWAKGSRVPASASGLKRVWFRRLHHPRRRCAPCLVPRRQAASNRGTSQTLTSQGTRVLLVPARPLGPSGSALVPDGLGPPFSPDHNSSCDLDPSLKLRILGSEEKGIRGTDADLRFSSSLRSSETGSSVGVADSPSGTRSLSLRSFSGCRSPIVAGAPQGPYCVATLLALQRPVGGVLGCLAPMPCLRFAPSRTPAVSRPSRPAATTRRCRERGLRWSAPGAAGHGVKLQNHFANDSARSPAGDLLREGAARGESGGGSQDLQSQLAVEGGAHMAGFVRGSLTGYNERKSE